MLNGPTRDTGSGRDPAVAAGPERNAMERDPEREVLRQRLRAHGVSLAAASRAIGRNRAWLHQYLARGIPRVLSWQDSAALAELLHCDPALLRHAERSLPGTRKRKKRGPPSGPSPLADVPEIEIGHSDETDRDGEASERESARWRMPEAMVCEELGADPANLRIVRVRGNAMEPVLREGDRLVVDTARRLPRVGGLFVLREYGGLAVWRVEPVGGTEPQQLRLSCANPDYRAHTCLAGDVHVLGEVTLTMIKE